MKAKSSVLTIRVPRELKHKIEQIADRQGVSINQLALYAFTKEIKEIEVSDFFIRYLKNKGRKQILADFDSVMGKIGHGEISEWDKL